MENIYILYPPLYFYAQLTVDVKLSFSISRCTQEDVHNNINSIILCSCHKTTHILTILQTCFGMGMCSSWYHSPHPVQDTVVPPLPPLPPALCTKANVAKGGVYLRYKNMPKKTENSTYHLLVIQYGGCFVFFALPIHHGDLEPD